MKNVTIDFTLPRLQRVSFVTNCLCCSPSSRSGTRTWSIVTDWFGPFYASAPVSPHTMTFYLRCFNVLCVSSSGWKYLSISGDERTLNQEAWKRREKKQENGVACWKRCKRATLFNPCGETSLESLTGFWGNAEATYHLSVRSFHNFESCGF